MTLTTYESTKDDIGIGRGRRGGAGALGDPEATRGGPAAVQETAGSGVALGGGMLLDAGGLPRLAGDVGPSGVEPEQQREREQK
ncbi:hypothetical protein GPECTOR_263g676 [Gonium pectorale]|uniref:Uncharacterized protein n=1 Tax=Gonium pectorale TaxID=33097 RepID=A0A150FW64_GONPE|nr:hypothetical protein GPECTOR_263g676 [Gonium pectorale]|eukprot:KXZ41846.1 hypothetical protein GPECTOR_263g676 [Gonium pectorale]